MNISAKFTAHIVNVKIELSNSFCVVIADFIVVTMKSGH